MLMTRCRRFRLVWTGGCHCAYLISKDILRPGLQTRISRTSLGYIKSKNKSSKDIIVELTRNKSAMVRATYRVLCGLSTRRQWSKLFQPQCRLYTKHMRVVKKKVVTNPSFISACSESGHVIRWVIEITKEAGMNSEHTSRQATFFWQRDDTSLIDRCQSISSTDRMVNNDANS